MDDQGPHQARVAEAHLGLGRMHVDVDLTRVERNEQGNQRMAISRQIIGVSCAYRTDQKLVAHGPAVDKKILAERVRSRERRQCGKAFDGNALALGCDLDGVGAELGAENIAQAREPPGGAWKRSRKSYREAFLASERESNVGAAHGETAHDFAHGFRLGAVELEKLQSRRCGVEEIAHLDARALGERRGP